MVGLIRLPGKGKGVSYQSQPCTVKAAAAPWHRLPGNHPGALFLFLPDMLLGAELRLPWQKFPEDNHFASPLTSCPTCTAKCGSRQCKAAPAVAKTPVGPFWHLFIVSSTWGWCLVCLHPSLLRLPSTPTVTLLLAINWSSKPQDDHICYRHLLQLV